MQRERKKKEAHLVRSDNFDLVMRVGVLGPLLLTTVCSAAPKKTPMYFVVIVSPIGRFEVELIPHDPCRFKEQPGGDGAKKEQCDGHLSTAADSDIVCRNDRSTLALLRQRSKDRRKFSLLSRALSRRPKLAEDVQSWDVSINAIDRVKF